MFPIFALNNSTDARRVNSELPGYLSLRYTVAAKLADFSHLIGSEARGVHGLTFNAISVIHSALRYHVARIVRHCPKPQMIWIDASRIISVWAVMQNVQPIRDGAVGQFPRDSVGEIGAGRPIQNAVTIGICASAPQPALIRLTHRNIVPKLLCDRFAFAVSHNKSYRLSYYPSSIHAGVFRNRGRLTTAAHTEPRWIDHLLIWCSVLMFLDIRQRFARNDAAILMCRTCNSCFLAASTLTVSVRNFLCVHSVNLSTIYTYKAWQKVDSLSEATG